MTRSAPPASAYAGYALPIITAPAFPDAACIPHRDDPRWFNPLNLTHPPEDIVSICRSCPHTSDCLDHALNNHELGIWGGSTERQRKRLRREAKSRGVTFERTRPV